MTIGTVGEMGKGAAVLIEALVTGGQESLSVSPKGGKRKSTFRLAVTTNNRELCLSLDYLAQGWKPAARAMRAMRRR